MKSLTLALFLVVLAKASGEEVELEWWKNAVFYEIYPRSFADSDGDGVGDIRGIINHLDHLKDLGVQAFWLGPIFRSTMIDSGYDITNHREVDPLFGRDLDLMELITRAHALDLKIILDFVPNQTSEQHPWFQLSASNTPGFENYYIWMNCPMEGNSRRYHNNWISTAHTPSWTFNPTRNQCYLHQHAPGLPDLNYREPRVYQEMLDVVTFWLERGVDGFRIDGVPVFETAGFPFAGFLPGTPATQDRTARETLDLMHVVNRPESFVFIETVRSLVDNFTRDANDGRTRIVIADTFDDTQLRWYGQTEGTPAAHIPRSLALIEGIELGSNARNIMERILDSMDMTPIWAEPNFALGDHDTSRVNSRLGEGAHEGLAMLSLMLPGPKFIYYGEEIQMTDHRGITIDRADDPVWNYVNATMWPQFTRDFARTPFQWNSSTNAGFSPNPNGTWLPVHPNYRTINLQAQKDASRSTYKLYQKLLELRKEYKCLEIGTTQMRLYGNDTIGLLRTAIGHPSIGVILYYGIGDTTVQMRDIFGDEYDGGSGRILASTTRSSFREGQGIGDSEDLFLHRYDAIVMEISSAGKVAASLLVLALALLRFIF